MYVDEVGDASTGSSIQDENHRYLSLTGVIFRRDYVATHVSPDLEKFKQQTLGSHPDDPVVLHRREVIHGKRPFQVLQDQARRASFDAGLLELLRRWDYTVITVAIDKLSHVQEHRDWHYEPYHYCLACLLERYVYFLRRRRSRGDVLAEARGGREDRALKSEYLRIWNDGTYYLKADEIQTVLTSRQLKVKQKRANIAGFQIADLLAHTSRCEVLREHDRWEKPIRPFAEQLLPVLAEKYDRSGTRNWGKKLLE